MSLFDEYKNKTVKPTTQPTERSSAAPVASTSLFDEYKTKGSQKTETSKEAVASLPPITPPKKTFAQKYIDFSNRIGELGAEMNVGIVRSVGSTLSAVETVLKEVTGQKGIIPGFENTGLNLLTRPLGKPIDRAIEATRMEETPNIGDVITRFADEMDKYTGVEEKKFLDHVFESLGSSVPFIAAGVYGKLAGVSAGVLNLGLSGTEALVNSYDDYNELEKQGVKNSKERAVVSFAGNLLVNYITNKLGFIGGSENPGVKSALGVVKKYLFDTGLEIGQETLQQVVSDVVKGTPIDKALQNAGQTALVSAPIAGLFGGIGMIEGQERSVQATEPEKKRTEAFLTDVAAQGATISDTAKVVASMANISEAEATPLIEAFLAEHPELTTKFQENTAKQADEIANEIISEEENIDQFLNKEVKADEALFQKQKKPKAQFEIGGKKFPTLKEAQQYQSEVQAENRKYMLEPDRQTDATIRGMKEEKPQDKMVSAERGAQKLQSYQKRLGIRFATYIHDKIYTGEIENGRPVEALGMYLDKTISLASAITEFTADHEIGHFAFRNLDSIPAFKGTDREKIYTELRNKYGNMSKTDLEEKLMEDFEKFAAEKEANKPTTFKGKIKAFFESLYNSIKELLNISPQEKSSIDAFYDTLYFGKGDGIVTFENTGKASAFIEERLKQFGEEEKPVFKVSEERIEDDYNDMVADQKTTEKRETMKVIQEQMFPKKDKLTIGEQAQIKKRLKEQGKGFKKGEKAGVKIGKAEQKGKSDIEIEEINRTNELKQLREAIIKRSYTKSILDVLRKNIPKSEWGTYMTRLSQVGLSETKFTNLLEEVYERRAELDTEEGIRSDESKARSAIGYLKHVFDIEPSLILSIKRDLQIDKSIKNMSLIELLQFKEELKKRIEFRKNNPVNYLAFASLEKPSKLKKLGEAIKKVDQNIIAPLERKVKQISKPLYESLMTVFFQEAENNKIDSENVKPLVDIFNKATPEDQMLITQKAQSADENGLRIILEKYASSEEVTDMLNNARKSLDRIHNDLKSVDVDVPYRGFFFPRKMKPLTVEQADLMLKTFEYKMGKKATDDEKTKIINNLLRGFNVSQMPFVTLSGKRFEAHRLLETLSTEFLPFYEDFATALQSYIGSANSVIEQRKFFGKTNVETLDYDANLENSIGAKVLELENQGIITTQKTQEIKDTLQTLFAFRLSAGQQAVQQFTNDYIYPLTLGQLTSTFSQLKDLSMQTLMDLFEGQLNTVGKQSISPKDINLSESIQELESSVKTSENKVAQFGKKVMTPFGKADQFFLTAFINSSYKRMVKLAKSGSPRFVKGMEDIFGKEKSQEVIADLKTKTGKEPGSELSPEVKRWLFSEVAKTRPITKLQKARGAIRSPAWYTLKNFAIKQLEFVRAQSLDHISEGVKNGDKKQIAEGVGKFVVILSYMAMLGAGVDDLKDWILGKAGKRSFWDHITDNMLQVFGLNSYMINMAQKEGLGKQIFTSYTPAVGSITYQIFDDIVSDFKSGEPIEDIKSIKRFPLIGNIFYNRFGGGSD